MDFVLSLRFSTLYQFLRFPARKRETPEENQLFGSNA